MKKIAVMQPYFFPYIGYYQLVYSVDEFVFFDDVSLIRRGFINRNFIVLNGKPFRFVLPILHASQHRKIKEHHYLGHLGKFFAQLSYAYKKAPYFRQVYPLVEQTIHCGSDVVSVVNRESVNTVLKYLNLSVPLSESSKLEIGDSLVGQDRILEICKRKSASHYHNVPGGEKLYRKEAFERQKLKLRFLHSEFTDQAITKLSIIDTLMWNSPATIRCMLANFHLD